MSSTATTGNTMRVLYLAGHSADQDATIQKSLALYGGMDVDAAPNGSEALTRLRGDSGLQALFVSPTLPHNETLALIATLRRDKTPVAIVPVVTPEQQPFFATAVASGADDAVIWRDGEPLQFTETMARVRQSPYLQPSDPQRRMRVLYLGDDQVVWELIEQCDFITATRATSGADGQCQVRDDDSEDGLAYDAVVVDERPGDANPLLVVRSLKSQSSDLPVVVLTPPAGVDVATAALELGADDAVGKTGSYRRRLIATMRRAMQRRDLMQQHVTLRGREARLRQIVETMPEGIAVIGNDGAVLAMNLAAIALFGEQRSKDVVGRSVYMFVNEARRDAVREFVQTVSEGAKGDITFEVTANEKTNVLQLRGVPLPRDARARPGVIASVAMAGGAAAAPTAQDTQALSQAFRDLENSLAEVEAGRERERAEWAVARAALEHELETMRTHAGDAQGLVDGLREAGDSRCQELERRLHDAEAQLATALGDREALTEEHTQITATLQTGWIRERSDLEDKLRDAEARAAALDARLTELRETPPAVAPAPAPPVAAAPVTIVRYEAPAQNALPETRQLARLADVGRLTASMTQELEPLLTGLDGDVRGVLHADSIDTARAHAQSMSERVSESQMLVQQLAGFSRKQQEPTAAQDLAAIARGLEPAVKPLMGPHVALRLDLTGGVTVDATRADVEQMLTTLLIAGRDLLPVGGSLVVRTGANEDGAAVLTVTAQGYGVVTDANPSALAAVVRQCNGTLTTGPAARAFEFKICF